MQTFTAPLQELNEYSGIVSCLKRGDTPILATGCIDSQKCHLIYGIGEELGARIRVIVTYHELKAKEIYEDYKLYDREICFYPAKDIMFFSADLHGNAIVRDRLKTIQRLLERDDKAKKPLTVVLSLEAGMDRILPLDFVRENLVTIRQQDQVDLQKLSRHLAHLGYEKTGQVEGPGQFAVRGGILDIFPLTEECPYRIEFWDDEVDTIRSFDVASQRSIEPVEELVIYPAAEIILDEKTRAAGMKRLMKEKEEQVKALRLQMKTEEAHRLSETVEEFRDNLEIYSGSFGIESYIRYFYDNTVSFYDYFDPAETVFFLDEPLRLIEKGEAVEMEFRESMTTRLEKGYILPGQADVIWEYRTLLADLARKRTLLLSTLEARAGAIAPKRHFDLTVKSVNSYNNNFALLVKDLQQYKRNGFRVILVCASRTRAERISADLRAEELNAFYTEDLDREVQRGEIITIYGGLHRGFEYPLIKLVVISESDIFGAEKKKRKKKRGTYDGRKLASFSELHVGDYVVHENHGLGIYRGIEKIEVNKIVKDYIKIEYGGGGVLYVLATGLDVLQKYAGAEAKKPKLNKLNSVEWKNTKAKVKGSVREIAKELVELYAKRQAENGYQFSPDTVWQREFEELFPYEETDDQLRAIEDTKRDMESRKIMDRLICGDVGYGKTEVAIRAAFKAVSDGKQVVLLVPTTILAQQHYNTFVQRMKDFPISVDMLSRFKTAAEQRKIVEQLKKGSLDIIIGTHRVLSSDIHFKNLGLLIVDEEQRFGVTHKEKIKQLRTNIDVLTLSATPIPRTLHMSLAGIRDMSVLEEPPVDRLPIQTYVLEYNEEIVREAVNRELVRGGQVYYVYNRVNGIDEVADRIAKQVPDANVSYAHGQMSERELERIMFEFINGEIDVLVSTTIIETGLDISNVNTMIIEDADRLGLSQLYQLRGRVGRSNRTAYAFLMYKRNKMLREIAEKRLQAIREFTELGSGFKIAMRDLEIRGAGNLLGAKQHGHMEAVGYDLYCKMLNEAVRAMKGETVEEESFETTVDFDMDAYIPSSYMKNEVQKLDMYKRVAEIENREELMDLQDELIDRFGELPQAVENLLNIALIKAMAHRVYVSEVTYTERTLRLVMEKEARLDAAKIPELITRFAGRLKFRPGQPVEFFYEFPAAAKSKGRRQENAECFQGIRQLLEDFTMLLLENTKKEKK